MKRKYLPTPGPSLISEHASMEMAHPMQHQQTHQCNDIFRKTTEEAKYRFQTKQDILIFATTKTAGDIL